MSVVLDIVSAVLLISGAALGLAGAVGLLRFPDTLARLHAAAKPQVLGLVLVLIGALCQAPAALFPAFVLIVLLQMTTAPVTAQIVGRTAHRTRSEDE